MIDISFIRIPLAPITKKNSQRIFTNKSTGKPFITQSQAYKEYEERAGWFIKRPKEAINCKVNVRCLFYMPTERRVDLVNLQEAALDILTKYGVLEDDNSKIVVSMDGSRVLHDKSNPRTDIWIEKYESDTY